MRIVIDMQGVQTPFSGTRGVGRYTSEMVKALIKISAGKHEIFLVLNGSFQNACDQLLSEFKNLLPRNQIKIWQQYLTPVAGITGNRTARSAAEIIREWYLYQLEPDVIWLTNLQEGWLDDAVTSVQRIRNPTAIFVSTLHDVIPLMFPDKYLATDIKYWYAEKIEYARRSDVILTVSEFSKSRITELLQLPARKVVVAPNSVNKTVFNTDPSVSGFSFVDFEPGNYILYVGGADEHKNLERLIVAYGLIDDDLKKANRLVFAGMSVKHQEHHLRQVALKNSLHESSIIFLGEVSDSQLSELMRRCAVFVFPSYSEGFGLPPLEAMACGAPVIGANAASIPDVIGLADAMFDPFDENDIASKLSDSLSNVQFRSELRKHARGQVDKFSWDKSAEIVLNTFQACFDAKSAKNKIAGSSFGVSDLIKELSSLDGVENLDLSLLANSISDNVLSVNSARRIFLDISCVVHFDHGTGIQRVVRAICDALQDGPPGEYEIIEVYSFSGHDKFYTAKISGGSYVVDEANDGVVEFMDGDVLLILDLHPGSAITKRTTFSTLKRRGVDVFFIVYDLVPVNFPNYFVPELPIEFSQWLHVVAESSGAICISHDVEMDFIKWVGLNKIDLPPFFRTGFFHLGADLKNSKPSFGLPANGKDFIKHCATKTTFLMVGTVEPRKGHAFVLDAFEALWAEGCDIDLVIVGREGWRNENTAHRIRSHSRNGKSIHWLEGISDEYLEKIYGAATCLIAASEAEGFGLPLIEAAKFKMPIIARDIPVFREVAGGHAHYFIGKEPLDLVMAVKEWLEMYESNTYPSSENMPWLTWKQSAKSLMKVLSISR